MSTGESLHFEHHHANLAGSLYKPDSLDPVPVVIVLHSASGGLRTNRFYEHLTALLPACGIAVFVYDRRGSGGSTGSFETANFALLAADAQAAIAALTTRNDIDRQRIGLYGISQGGWIAPLVAAHDPAVSLLVIVSGCGLTPAEQMIYSAQTALREAHYPEAIIAAATQLRQHVDAYYRGTLQRPVVQAELDAVRSEPWFPLAYVNEELPDNAQQSKWYLEIVPWNTSSSAARARARTQVGLAVCTPTARGPIRARAIGAGHSPGGKSVDAASAVCASKLASRLRRVVRVLSSACEPSTMRSGAGSTSTLSMMRAAMRAGSPGARPFFGSSSRTKLWAGVSS